MRKRSSSLRMISRACIGRALFWSITATSIKRKQRLERVLRTPGEFGGLGIRVTQEDGLFKVVTTIDNSPASRAGIMSGDIIAGIDGESVQGLDLNQVLDKMRGVPDTTVRIRILHGPDKNSEDIKLTRATIQIKRVPAQKFWALICLGSINAKRGDLQGALKSYNDGLALIEPLVKSDPGNAEWQRDLEASYNKVGGVQQARGDREGALKSYSDGLAIGERLAKSDPGNALWQRDLSVSYNMVGEVQEAQGDREGALKSYSESLAIAERLAKSDPGNAEWQHDLAFVLRNDWRRATNAGGFVCGAKILPG